ncbi:MAG TPA: PadR family transcriptional regulator [Acidimicrobiales bacterium]|nr:PadR family transcriptional regulator [Acidimicrobiales bacterium]
MRRGDIRTALLGALEEGPAHGYELIGRLEQKSGGMWRPSPGSVYPTLQMFEDEGLVRSEERDGKRTYELTDAGRAEAAERQERAGDAPWAGTTEAGEFETLFRAAKNLFGAARQVAHDGHSDQLGRATTVIRTATKELYQILSED